jgi:hypothetical protein
LGDTDPTGYLRHALGPPRPAPKEGGGWLLAAGELAMSAEDQRGLQVVSPLQDEAARGMGDCLKNPGRNNNGKE